MTERIILVLLSGELDNDHYDALLAAEEERDGILDEISFLFEAMFVKNILLKLQQHIIILSGYYLRINGAVFLKVFIIIRSDIFDKIYF
jgi:hypothetical protein